MSEERPLEPLPPWFAERREKLTQGEHAEEIGQLFNLIEYQYRELVDLHGQAMGAIKRTDKAQREVKERDGIIVSLNRQIAAMREGATET